MHFINKNSRSAGAGFFFKWFMNTAGQQSIQTGFSAGVLKYAIQGRFFFIYILKLL